MGADFVSSFVFWWTSVHEHWMGATRSQATQHRWQSATAPGSHQPGSAHTRQALESSNKNADFSELTLPFCAYSCRLMVTISRCAAQLLQQLLWKPGAAPISQGQIVQGVGWFQPWSQTHCKKTTRLSRIWSNYSGLSLAEGKGVKQVPNSTAGTTPNCSHHSKRETLNGSACQHRILTKPIFSIARGLFAIWGSTADTALLGGVACHSDGRLTQRI